MKAQDLMIGDIVAVNKTPLQIAALGTAKAGFIEAKGEMFYHYYDNIKPISLTAEILENNGWEYGNWGSEEYDDEYYTFIDDFDIHIDENQTFEIRTVDGCTIKIKYVHELQHVLRICGMEKQINL